MIRHDIYDESHVVFAQGRIQRVEAGDATQFGVDDAMVYHIVAVGALRDGSENGGEVDVRDPKGAQVGDDGGGIGEREVAVQLQAIGCIGRAVATHEGARLGLAGGVHH